MYAGNLADAVDDVFQVLQVGDIENNIDVGLCIRAAHLDIADIGFRVADDGRNLFQHAETIIAEDRKLHRIRTRGSFIVGPFHIDSAFRLVHQIHHVGAIHGVDGDAFAASHIADHVLAADGVAAAGAIHQQIAVALYADGVVAAVSAKNPAHDAGDPAGLVSFGIGNRRG